MAIYHFSAKVMSRSAGSSAVASAAYRSASRLRDDRLDRSHDFTNKSGVVHSEVMLPEGAPEEFRERERLWNAVEAAEVRKDAQLSREIEFAIPRELDQAQGIELARDFVQQEFVDRGMIADLNVHWDMGADGLAKPHAHVMLSMREVDEQGFGAKVRDWNRTEFIEHWRQAWEGHANARLASLDIDVRIDHRSFEAQGLDLEPQSKIGAAAGRRFEEGLDADRLEEHIEIARSNGERIIHDPSIALDAITKQQATFTRKDLAMFIHRHSDGKEQFDAAMNAVQTSPDLVELGKDGLGQERFTSRDMVSVEERLHRAAELMADRERHRVGEREQGRALEEAEARGMVLSDQQRDAFQHVTDGHDLSVVVGYAGTGKSALLGVAREAWEEAGYEVQGIALSGIAAENLEAGSGIASRTIASLEHQWAKADPEHRQHLTSRSILVIDEAGMIGSRQMERVLSHAQEHDAKVVLVGDPEQLQAIEAGTAFRSIVERQPHVEITEVRRQQEGWQRDATRHLATGRTDEALGAYEAHGAIHAAETREQARTDLVDHWDQSRLAEPGKSRIILTHTNNEVRDLNLSARERLRDAGQLGDDVALTVERGERQFASGDRVMMLKNDRGLQVKNGMLGEIEAVTQTHMSVHLDAGRSVSFDLKDYNQIDHGYAATIHKAQGVTVDRTHVLATPGLDRHASYVALSRHRENVDLHYGRDDFDSLGKLSRTLSRERGKDMASDYVQEERAPAREAPTRRPEPPRAGPPQPKRQDPPQQPQRSIFADFQPRQAPVPPPIRERAEDLQRRAIERHARAATDVLRMAERGLPVLAHQRQALDQARDELKAIGISAKEVERVQARDPTIRQEAASGRVQRTLRAVQLEAELRANPQMRADRFVERWQGLERQRDALYRSGDMSARRQVSESMAAMAKSLERDPQMESLLRGRKHDLGVHIDMGGSLTHELSTVLGLGRGRGIGL